MYKPCQSGGASGCLRLQLLAHVSNWRVPCRCLASGLDLWDELMLETAWGEGGRLLAGGWAPRKAALGHAPLCVMVMRWAPKVPRRLTQLPSRAVGASRAPLCRGARPLAPPSFSPTAGLRVAGIPEHIAVQPAFLEDHVQVRHMCGTGHRVYAARRCGWQGGKGCHQHPCAYPHCVALMYRHTC